LLKTRIRRFTCALVLPLAFIGIDAPGAFATNVSGTISSNTAWTSAASPYVMTGSVTVAAGVTLTMEPGVVVQGNSSTRSLTINGSLSAVGSSSQHITLTSTSNSAPGQWMRLKFASGSGSSTLKFVDVRYGGGPGISDLNGMVDISGGTITIEDSTFKYSSVSGLKIAGGASGTDATVTIRRSKFESNGYVGTDLHGDGINGNNANVVIEDSAFWSNASDGLEFVVSAAYSPAPAQITGSSIWNNERYGVYVNNQNFGAEGLAIDGHVEGKPGNAIYDNGTYGYSVSEKWWQLELASPSLDIDWRGAYWGPVTVDYCIWGNGNPHLSYGAPDPNPFAEAPIPRGPVHHTFVFDPFIGDDEELIYQVNYCGNDWVLVDPPASSQPDLYFDAPPSVLEP
jgi:hypothetical protein